MGISHISLGSVINLLGFSSLFNGAMEALTFVVAFACLKKRIGFSRSILPLSFQLFLFLVVAVATCVITHTLPVVNFRTEHLIFSIDCAIYLIADINRRVTEWSAKLRAGDSSPPTACFDISNLDTTGVLPVATLSITLYSMVQFTSFGAAVIRQWNTKLQPATPEHCHVVNNMPSVFCPPSI